MLSESKRSAALMHFFLLVHGGIGLRDVEDDLAVGFVHILNAERAVPGKNEKESAWLSVFCFINKKTWKNYKLGLAIWHGPCYNNHVPIRRISSAG